MGRPGPTLIRGASVRPQTGLRQAELRLPYPVTAIAALTATYGTWHQLVPRQLSARACRRSLTGTSVPRAGSSPADLPELPTMRTTILLLIAAVGALSMAGSALGQDSRRP